MKELIKEINAIPGVSEACVFSRSQGAVYSENNPQAILNHQVLQAVGMHFIRLFQMGGMAGLSLKSSHFYFNRYVVIGIALDADTVALIICEAHVNCSLVTTTVSMLASEIREEVASLSVHDASSNIVASKDDPISHPAEGALSDEEEIQPYMTSIQEALATVIGPVAGIVLRDSKSKWMTSGPANAARLPQLIRILMEEIGDDALAKEFRLKVKRIELS